MKRALTIILALCLLFSVACTPSTEERISRTSEAVALLNESSKLLIDMLEPTQSNAEYPDLRPTS